MRGVAPMQPSPTYELDLPKAMRQRVEKRLRQLPIITAPTTGEESSTDKDQLAPHLQRPLKSSMQHTGGFMVVKIIMWPHEVIYPVATKPTAFEELSIPLFMQGYLIVMKGDEEAIRAKMATPLEELMNDSELYG